MDGDTYTTPKHGWTCFHCGETFTTVGAARDHFGADPLAEPGCRIKAGAERGLLMALRRVEAELYEYRIDAIEALRTTIRNAERISLDRHLLVRDAEEDGYAKGLEDGMRMSAQQNEGTKK